MNPTATEIEEVEINSQTSTGVDSIRDREGIESPNGDDIEAPSYSPPKSPSWRLSRQQYRQHLPEPLLGKPPSFQAVTRLDDREGFRTSSPKAFLERQPSHSDMGPYFRRNSSFGEPPRLSVGDLLDIPSAPSSPERPQHTDQSHPLSPQRKNDTSAAGSPPNRPSVELVAPDTDSTGINNITDASSSLRRPQHVFDVVLNAIKQEHKINIPSTSEEILVRDSADDATNTMEQGHTDNIPNTTLPVKAPPNLPCGDLLDVALKIMKNHPQLARNGSALGILARKPDAIFDGVQPKLLTRIRNSIFGIMNVKVGPAEEDSDALKLLTIIWNEITMMPKSQVDDILRGPRDSITRDGRIQYIYPFRILFVAAEMGNTRFVIKLLQAHPHLIVSRNDELRTIFHVVVMNRQCDIHNLLYEIGAQKDLILPLRDRDGNNMLHLLGKTSVNMRPKTFGASLLMQRELLWFKEIEMMMQPALRQSRNNVGQTPYELFSEENKDLVVQGLKWMKDCMVVATLIVVG